MNFFRMYTMRLYQLNKNDLVVQLPKKQVEYVPVTYENLHWAKSFSKERQFRRYLKMGDFGYYAMLGGNPIGYGWEKQSGSKDLFYKVNSGSYLGKFYVDNKYRGNNIYPSMIAQLVQHSSSENFYIAAYNTNVSSLRGLEKTGFSFLREDTVFRIFKITLNKKLLKK